MPPKKSRIYTGNLHIIVTQINIQIKFIISLFLTLENNFRIIFFDIERFISEI